MYIERYLTKEDAAILSRLAERLLRNRDVKLNHAEQLAELLSNAMVLPESYRKGDFVSINSEVTYSKLGKMDQHAITIVPPQEANQTLARVSVLAPIGLALIGRQTGSVVEVRLRSDQAELLTIIDIHKVPWASGIPVLHEEKGARFSAALRRGVGRY